MTKYLAIAFLITGFLVGDAYGADDWDDEKAKSYGMPLIGVGTTIFCEVEKSIGFRWENGSYRNLSFKKSKYIFKKVEINKYCKSIFGKPIDFEAVNSEGMSLKNYQDVRPNGGSRHVCINHYRFGEKPPTRGKLCSEHYFKRDGIWEVGINCEGGNYDPQFYLSPNGFFHYSFMHALVTPNPPHNSKDDQLMEWGKCATISP
jgi:hypothetical protein